MIPQGSSLRKIHPPQEVLEARVGAGLPTLTLELDRLFFWGGRSLGPCRQCGGTKLVVKVNDRIVPS